MDHNHAASNVSHEQLNNLYDNGNRSYHAYDQIFQNGELPDAGWPLDSSAYNPASSRAQQPSQPWQNANHLSTTTPGNYPGQDAPAYSRSLSHSPSPFGAGFGGYPGQSNGTFQYQQPAYDPNLFNNNVAGFQNQPSHPGTVAPQALQQALRSPAPTSNVYNAVNFAPTTYAQQRPASTTSAAVDQHALMRSIPKGAENGLFSTIDFDQMVRATNSERMGNFATVGREAQEWPINRTMSLPQYVPRRSKNESRKLAGNDPTLLARIGKKAMAKSYLAGSSATAKAVTNTGEQIKYEGDSSSSEESSDDDDDSSYTSDEDLEGSPLPNKRPDGLKEGIEYDAIKALWHPKRKSPSGDDIKKALIAFWEVVKTIRDRWKSDAAAVTQAEEKGRKGELPLLKSRVKDGRDMVETAFKAALKHGHRGIVELLGENSSLVFLCYQFLLDRLKEDDVNGPLPRTILELMSQFTTLTPAVLEKTHIDKLMPRYVKKGDAKTQYFAKKVTANANANAGAPAKATTAAATATATAGKAATTAKNDASASPIPKRSKPEPVAGVKRPTTSTSEGAVPKKVATGATKPTSLAAAAKPTGIVKKAGDGQPVAAAAATPVAKTKQVIAKPSSFFSSLQSAAKKPGTSIRTGAPAQASGANSTEKTTATGAPKPSAAPAFSFAATLSKLEEPKEEKRVEKKPEKEAPPETVEEKAKRLRKEARRKLHVSFKVGDELEEIRYFTHHPEEELGHDDSQMRDVTDVGGEGRMLKLHADMMDVDEEDDGEDESKFVAFRSPSAIEFNVLPPDERDRNYARFGGKLEPDSPERLAREKYETDTLSVFYTDEKDIPPNPREPAELQASGASIVEVKQFGAPEPKYITRAKQRKAMQPDHWYQNYQKAPQQQQASNAAGWQNQQQAPPPQMQQPSAPPPPGITPELQQLLAKLQHQQQPQAAAQPPTMMNYGPTSAALAPTVAALPPQVNGQQAQPDIASILAALKASGAVGGAAPTPPHNFGASPPQQQPPQQQPPQQQGGDDMFGGDGQGDGAGDKKQRWRDQGDKNKFYKTKVCKYWQEGRCMKGDGCTYLHEDVGN